MVESKDEFCECVIWEVFIKNAYRIPELNISSFIYCPFCGKKIKEGKDERD